MIRALGALCTILLVGLAAYYVLSAPLARTVEVTVTPIHPVETPAPTPALRPLDAIREAGLPPVAIVITDDPNVNCGAAASASGKGGCFTSKYPDQIHISSGLDGEALRYIVLHEYAHWHQYHNDLPLDECEADRLAIEWGAHPLYSYYDCELK